MNYTWINSFHEIFLILNSLLINLMYLFISTLQFGNNLISWNMSSDMDMLNNFSIIINEVILFWNFAFLFYILMCFLMLNISSRVSLVFFNSGGGFLPWIFRVSSHSGLTSSVLSLFFFDFP